MKIQSMLICLSLIFFPLAVNAETKQTLDIGKVTQDYANCLDAVLGNFNSDNEAQAAMKKFYAAIISNTETIINNELKANHEGTKLFLEMFQDKKIFTGYMVAKFAEPDQLYLTLKKDLNKINNFDWRMTNQSLWSSNGCNAIYRSL